MKKNKYEKPSFISQEDWDEYLRNCDDLGKKVFGMINNMVKKMNQSLEKKTIDDDLEFILCPDDIDDKKNEKNK